MESLISPVKPKDLGEPSNANGFALFSAEIEYKRVYEDFRLILTIICRM